MSDLIQPSDTGVHKSKATGAKQTAGSSTPWIKTPYANLIRYKPSGIYFARAHVCGKLVRKSLKTKSIEVAKVKLANLLGDERKRLAKDPDESLAWPSLVEEFKTRLEASTLKPRSKEYKLETLDTIAKTWANIEAMKAVDFSDDNVKTWAAKLLPTCSAPRYNGTVQTMRAVLSIAVERGLLGLNPARGKTRANPTGIPAAKVDCQAPELPTPKQFAALVTHMRKMPSRRPASDMVQFIAYTGARISAANKVTPKDIDLDRNEVMIPAIKYDERPTRVPIMAPLLPVLRRLLADYPGVGSLIPIANPKKALSNACKDLDMPHLSPHDLRHLFATRCLESGVDVRTVAGWIGHKDGGALLLRRYAHLLDEHSQKMARKVKFK